MLAFKVEVFSRDWRLHLDCGGQGCPRDRFLEVGVLSARLPDLTMQQALLRLRCTGCGGQPWRVDLYVGGRLLERLR